MKIILASSSPRRKKHFRKIVRKFSTAHALEPKLPKSLQFPSNSIRHLTSHQILNKAKELACFSAKAKAKYAVLRFKNALVISADTLLVCDKKIMGKPKSKKQAKEMLEHISAKKIVGISAICTYKPGFRVSCITKSGWVKIKKLKAWEISAYLSSNCWKGKAGAIDVGQKPVSRWVIAKGGDVGAVIGWPKISKRYILQNL